MEDETCIVTITPTYTACPAMKMIEGQVREILSGHGVKQVVVETVYSPAWTTDWLSTEAKMKLKQYGIAPPMHSSCAKLTDAAEVVTCPRCNSKNTSLISRFGSTACKALYKCNACEETFDFFKCH
jgi:ring-1,2-phenylacetyl-CoA epoxidase subunit PaaD